jgi:hypothetical protein
MISANPAVKTGLETPGANLILAKIAKALKRPCPLFLICLLATLQLLGTCLVLPERATSWDFSVYYMSGLITREGLDPYKTDFTPLGNKLGLEIGAINRATHPPPFLILCSVLTLLPEQIAYYVWQVLNAILLALTLALLFGKRSGLDRQSGLALAALALLYPPVRVHFFMSQANIPILFLLVSMMRAMERGRNRMAGVYLAVAVLLRIFPLVLAGYLLIQRRWQVLLWTLIGCMIGGLISVELIGLRNSISYRDGVALCLNKYFLSLHFNISLTAATSRLIWSIFGSGPKGEFLRHPAIILVEFLLLGLTIRSTSRLKAQYDPYWCGLSLWIVSAVLLSPTAWPHYMVLFLIVFAQIVKASVLSKVSSRTQLLSISGYLFLFILFSLPSISTLDAHTRFVLIEGVRNVLLEAYLIAAMLVYLSAYYFVLDNECFPIDT